MTDDKDADANRGAATGTKRERWSLDDFDLNIQYMRDELDADIMDANQHSAKRLQTVIENIDRVAEIAGTLSAQLRSVQAHIVADTAARQQLHDRVALSYLTPMTQSLALMPEGVIGIILQHVVEGAYGIRTRMKDVCNIKWMYHVGQNLLDRPGLHAHKQVRLLRTVCHAFCNALQRRYPFTLYVSHERNELQIPNLFQMQWGGIRVLNLSTHNLTARLRDSIADVLTDRTSVVRRCLPALAAVVYSNTTGSRIKLQSYAAVGELAAPALVYRVSNSVSVAVALRPTNLRYFKASSLPSDFAVNPQLVNVEVLATGCYASLKYSSSAVMPNLRHAILMQVGYIAKDLQEALVDFRKKFPVLTTLTYTPRHYEGSPLYAAPGGLPHQTAAAWLKYAGCRMMVDVFGLWRFARVAQATKYDWLVTKGGDLDHFMADTPMVYLFSRACVCAANATPSGHKAFVLWLLENGDTIHPRSALRIVETPFMEHLTQLGEPLPSVEMTDFVGQPRPVSECAASWLDKHLSYSPTFEETL